MTILLQRMTLGMVMVATIGFFAGEVSAQVSSFEASLISTGVEKNAQGKTRLKVGHNMM